MRIAARSMLAGVLAAITLPAVAQQTEPQQQAVAAAHDDVHWLRDEQSGCKAPDPNFSENDGIVWLGACRNGVIDGPGTLTFTNKGQPQVTISGTFRDGNLESGHAALSWPDGSKYDGDQTGGKFNGQGVFISAQQDRLQGTWKDGALNGDATVTWANGNRYQGGWSNGKAEGRGVETWANGDRYDGDWQAGIAQGHGVQVWANGQRYEGEWQNDMPNGTGTLVRPDGTQFAGKFVDGHPVVQTSDSAPPGPQQASAVPAPASTATPAPPTLPSPATSSPSSASASPTSASPTSASPSAASPAAGAVNKNLSEIEGEKLIAVDGSSLALSAADDGFTREITKPDGASSTTAFTFVNDRMGTVADANDPDHVTGMFKMADDEIDIDYSDGRSEVLKPALGGVAQALRAPQAGTTCVIWYPQGHVFSDSERKAALADYASKLGVAYRVSGKVSDKVSGRRGAKHVAACMVAATPAVSVVATPAVLQLGRVPHPAPRPIQASYQIPTPIPAPPSPAQTPAPVGVTKASALSHTESQVPALAAVEVRTSQVHLIDPPKPNIPNFAGGTFAAPAVANHAASAPAVATLPAAPSSVPQPGAPTPPAPATPSSAVASLDPYAPDLTDSGASSCLSVASDGTHWGFKNSCAYTVQFAYCLKGDDEVLAACKNGVIGGSAAPSSFSALVGDASMKEKSIDHQFRWVACSGGAGEVIPKLDTVDPPVGRCLRARQAAN